MPITDLNIISQEAETVEKPKIFDTEPVTIETQKLLQN